MHFGDVGGYVLSLQDEIGAKQMGDSRDACYEWLSRLGDEQIFYHVKVVNFLKSWHLVGESNAWKLHYLLLQRLTHR